MQSTEGKDSRYEEPGQVSISRIYRVAPEKVWRAWADPQALSQWFGSGQPGSVTAAEFDLRVGVPHRVHLGQRHRE